jgi:hypothetical protein
VPLVHIHKQTAKLDYGCSVPPTDMRADRYNFKLVNTSVSKQIDTSLNFFRTPVFGHCLTLRTEHKVPEKRFSFHSHWKALGYFESNALTCTVTVSVDTSTYSSENRNSSAFRKSGLLFRHDIMVSRYSSVDLRTTFRTKRSGHLS